MNGGDMKISLDKLPIKRLDSIEESGIERFPPEIGYDERRLALIRRIDFTPVVEKDAKKLKSSKEAAAAAATTPWPWQSLVENLQLAHQELSVIIDLINTVEANDDVTVAGMTRPKQLPNEVLSDLAVSAATKLQCFRHLGRYFKQSAKALEQQVAREARFYGALIRLQQNWKVKRQRLAVSAPGSEGFTIDLFDNLLSDSTAVFRPSSISTVRVDHDSAGMLTLQLPPKSCRSIQFGFVGDRSSWKPKRLGNNKVYGSGEHPPRESKKEANDEDVDKCIKETHSVLREIHRAIFDEQVFDLVNREAFYPSPGVNVTGIREDFIQLGIGQEASVFLSLVPFEQDADQMTDTMDQTQNGEGGILPSDAMVVRVAEEKHDSFRKNFPGLPNPIGCEIYLQQILQENVFVKAKDGHPSAGRSQVSGQQAGDGLGLLGHFSMTLAHRIFSKKVMAELENLVSGVPYLHLLSHPTWHSRTSSWSLFMKVPESILHAGRRTRSMDVHGTKNRVKSQFHTKVVVNDESISISGEGAPNVVGLFKGGSTDTSLMNQYDCDLADLPVILLQQVGPGTVIQTIDLKGPAIAGRCPKISQIGWPSNRQSVKLSLTPVCWDKTWMMMMSWEKNCGNNQKGKYWDGDNILIWKIFWEAIALIDEVASQVIRWLHEEALIVGMKASRDFLGLCFQLEQGDMLSLVAHVDPNNSRGCISWWLVMEDGLMEDSKLHTDLSNGGSENKRFLGYLSPEALYSLLMDLVSLCSGSGSF